MTINLFGVKDALDEEGKQVKRIQKALEWKLREWGQGEEAAKQATEALESPEPREAQKSSSQT